MTNHTPWTQRLISTYNGVDPVPSGQAKIIDVLNRVRTGDAGLRERVAEVRDVWTKLGKSAADKKKKSLPGATFGGQFTYRDTDYITSLTRLCVLDLDDVPGMVETRKRMLFEDPHVLAIWLSPRGNGLKVLVEFDEMDRESHDRCWASAREHFGRVESLRLDSMAADLYRLTYLSHDSEILIRPDTFLPEPFYPMAEDRFNDLPPAGEAERKAKAEGTYGKKRTLRDLDSDYDSMLDLGWNEHTCPSLAAIDPVLPGRAMSLVLMKNSKLKLNLVEKLKPRADSTANDRVLLVGPGSRDHVVNAWAYAVTEVGLTETQASAAVRAFVNDCILQESGNEYDVEESERQARRAAKVTRSNERAVARSAGALPPATGDRKDDRVKVYEEKETTSNKDKMEAPQRARIVINEKFATPDGKVTLMRWNEDDFEYTQDVGWKQLHHETLPHYMARYLGVIPGVEQSHIDSTVKHLRQLLNRDDITRVPCNLATGEWMKRVCLFRNCALDFARLEAGPDGQPEPMFIDKTPDIFSTFSIPHDLDLDATCPNWEAFLAEQFTGDMDRVKMMQEWFGYHLIPDNSLQKFGIFVGPTRSGKGTTMNVLRAMLGQARCTSAMADDLQSDFAMQPWIAKLSVLLDDVNEGGSRYGMAFTVDKIKSIVGSEVVTVNRKNKTKAETTVTWKFTITTNDIPRMRDDSGALAKRMLVLVYDKSHAGRENWNLSAELAKEMPGIVAWSVRGLCRLLSQGCFTESKHSIEHAEQIRLDSTPLLRFVREMFVVTPDGSGTVTNSLVYNLYERWCKENGEHAKPRNVLFKAMRSQSELRTVQFCQVRMASDGDVLRPKVIQGILLSADAKHLAHDMGQYPGELEQTG